MMMPSGSSTFTTLLTSEMVADHGHGGVDSVTDGRIVTARVDVPDIGLVVVRRADDVDLPGEAAAPVVEHGDVVDDDRRGLAVDQLLEQGRFAGLVEEPG